MMTRKQFLRSALELSAATLGLTVLSSCGSPTAPPHDSGARGPDAAGGLGGSDMTPPPPPSSQPQCVQDGTSVAIGSNHGHVLVVTKDDVSAAQDKTYNIQGTSDHPHTVTITADMFASLLGDHAIMTNSSFDADHDHAILVACA